MKVFQNKKKLRSYKEFLYILPFIILIAVFAYYPLYGWVYAFFDYRPPKPMTINDFVGFKWLFPGIEQCKKTADFYGYQKHLCHERTYHRIFMAASYICCVSE
jgi:ABC-type sugar transport system permease subunit